MPTLQPQTLPLDLTGQAPSNLVTGEVHTLSNQKLRACAVSLGSFYKDSLQVWDQLTGQPVAMSSIKFMNLLKMPSVMNQSGMEVYAVFVIDDENISDTIRINYQAVGGMYVRSYESVRVIIDALLADNRPIFYKHLQHLPVSWQTVENWQNAYPSTGMEWVCQALQDVTQAVLLGDDESHLAILADLDARLEALLSDFEAQVTSAFGAAFTNAQTAKTQAQAALSQVQAQASVVTQAASDASAAKQLATSLDLASQAADVRARDMIEQIIAGRGIVRYAPPSAALVPIYTPTHISTEVVDEDYIYIDAKGRFFYRPELPDDGTPLVAKAQLNVTKPGGTGQTRLSFEIQALDLREALYFQEITNPSEAIIASHTVNDGQNDRKVLVSGGVGHHCRDLYVVIQPIRYSAERPLGQATTSDTLTWFVPVQVDSGDIEITLDGIMHRTYSASGVTLPNSNPRLWVVGTDIMTNVLYFDPNNQERKMEILRSLFDTRGDYNTAQYGIDKSRSIKMKLEPGVKVKFWVSLKSLTDDTLLKTAVLNLRKTFAIRKTTGWVPQNPSAPGAQVPLQEQVVTVVGNPDGRRIRALSVDIDTALAPSPSVEVFEPVPCDPDYVIAAMFEATLVTYDTAGTGRRRLEIINKSSTVLDIQSIWYEKDGGQTELLDTLSWAEGQTHSYSHDLHAVVEFPVTGTGIEYIRYYLTNTQSITFGVTPGSQTVTVMTGIGNAPVSYYPVFAELRLVPSEVEQGEAAQVQLLFTDMRPNDNDVFTLEQVSPNNPAITEDNPGTKTITADADGLSSYAWPITGGASDIAVQVRANGATRTATLARKYVPVFDFIQLSASTGWIGRVINVAMRFSGLRPSAISPVTIDITTTDMAGLQGEQTVYISADAQGVGQATLEYTLEQAVAQIEITSGATTHSAQTQGSAFVSATLSAPSGIPGQQLTSTLTFTGLQPSTSTVVTLNEVVTAGSYENQATYAGDKSVTLVSDANGQATITRTVIVGTSDAEITYTYAGQTQIVSLVRSFYPILSSVMVVKQGESTSIDTTYTGEDLEYLVTFDNGPVGQTYIQVSLTVSDSQPSAPADKPVRFGPPYVQGGNNAQLTSAAIGGGQTRGTLRVPLLTHASNVGIVTLYASFNGVTLDCPLTVEPVMVIASNPTTPYPFSGNYAIDGGDYDRIEAYPVLQLATGRLALSCTAYKNSVAARQDVIEFTQLYDPATPGVDLSDYQISCSTSGSTINILDLSGSAQVAIGGLLTFDKSETYATTEKTKSFDLRVTHAPTQRELSKVLFDSRISNTKPLLVIGKVQSAVDRTWTYEAGSDVKIKVLPDGRLQNVAYYVSSQYYTSWDTYTETIDNWWMFNDPGVNSTNRASEVEVRAVITQVQPYAPVSVANGMLNWVSLTEARNLQFTIQDNPNNAGRVIGYLEFRHKSSGSVYPNKFNFTYMFNVESSWQGG